MASIAKKSLLALSLCLALGSSFVLPASVLSKSESSAISNNCSTIKQSLSQLQKIDSKTRTYLGTAYETIANKFITPLNLRLVRNNRPTLSEIQFDFSSEQAKFRDYYTDYMRGMENLININCQTEPDRFYDQLLVVRERRAKVKLATEELKKLTNQQYQAVVNLRQELTK